MKIFDTFVFDESISKPTRAKVVLLDDFEEYKKKQSQEYEILRMKHKDLLREYNHLIMIKESLELEKEMRSYSDV